ncbi:hypothetical protein CDL15_Pgr021091 [Punica granatum]|uniref:Beta-glucosidase 12-like n=1 Tax=Punica granatum TaxID=22663 RepID=A0A218XKW5_PUNGR|nr:hypothetical protein CDL15_Pgr021091 [Punica granatum]
MKPKYPTDLSRKAALRALDFGFGWIVHPITFGDYPRSMRSLVGTRLPNFTTAESDMLRGSHDFLGVNYYTARYVDESTSYSTTNLSYTTDCHCNQTTEKDGFPIGEPTAVDWIYIYPKGIRKLMHYVKNKYNPPIIYVTENGVNLKGYLAWSFLDDFEWAEGYTARYGLTFIDYKNGLQRYLKNSSLWFKRFLLKENPSHSYDLHVSY